MIKQCKYCGKDFEKTSNCQKYCSKKCGAQFYRDTHKKEISEHNKKRYPDAHMKIIKQCAFCGKDFETETKSRMYCSETCKTYRWERDNPEKAKTNKQNTKQKFGKGYKLKYRYDMTIYDKREMYEFQKHKCYICENEFDEGALIIDHNHSTENVRGLLCRQCNSGLGHFADNSIIIHNAIDYLTNDGYSAVIENIKTVYLTKHSCGITKICTHCNKSFIAKGNACFCSMECKNKHRYAKKPKQFCFICDKEFNKKLGTRFCSYDCANKQWDIENYSEMAKKFYLADIEQHIKRLHDNMLLERYGITTECKHKIFEYQKQQCAICHADSKEDCLLIDHNHDSNKVRGLLCIVCNYGIGDFKDGVANLLNAIEYLEEKNESFVNTEVDCK